MKEKEKKAQKNVAGGRDEGHKENGGGGDFSTGSCRTRGGGSTSAGSHQPISF